MQPAKSIVVMLGGPQIVGKALKISTGAVTRWYTPIDEGGCGGLIPSRRIPELIGLAKTQGKFLEPNMFFEGHL